MSSPGRLRRWSRDSFLPRLAARPLVQRPLGLRARVTAGFALLAFGLSLTLALITYALTRTSVLHDAADSARRQTFVNASLLRGELRTPPPDISQLLASLETAASSSSVLNYGGQWYASSLSIGRQALPDSLRSTVLSGTAAEQSFSFQGHPELAIGVPIAAIQASYFEVFDLGDVRHTLALLAISLAAAAGVTTLLGAAVGRWASGRALAPLRETARVAARISQGHLDTRLEAHRDRDMTGLAESFNSMVDAVQKRIQRDARFASDVAHELRTPLTTLATSLDVISARRHELSPPGQEALDLLAAEVRQFESLVQDLLEISRSEAGVADAVMEPVRLAELVKHAMALEPGGDVPLVLEDRAQDLTIRGDKRRLERVIANLLSNARAHGGGAVQVTVAQRDGDALLMVDDAGPGIPAAERQRVFERFSRGRKARRRMGGTASGVGLGLALVAEHVAVHDGSVWVEDRPGGGARFVVRLPAAGSASPPGQDLMGNRSGPA